MSEQNERNSADSTKYNINIERAQGLVVGDNPQVTQNYTENNFYVVAPPPARTVAPLPALALSRGELLRSVHAAGAELRDYPNEIAGEHIERVETAEIVDWVMNASPNEKLGMVLDQPGGGKTVLMRDVLERLEAAGVPVLAVKSDALSGVEDAAGLGGRLGLPMSVEDCARYLASEGLFVVLTDQIDALSMTLSRDQAALSAILTTISRLRSIPNVRIISSCRTFDLRHDPRLSAIKADKEITLRPLSEEQVNCVLRSIGVDPLRLLPGHRELLTVPLHLDIYARIVTGQEEEPATESFRTLQELYEALWRRRIEATSPPAPSSTELTAAVYELVDVMRSRSQLIAPVATLDRHAGAARYLEQIAFIRRERSSYLFAHQTLFDYCYARRFVASGRSLSREILGGEQGLFERSQMVQVLAYLRGADETTYRRELTGLLFAENLRVHLRLLLMSWFGSLPKPTDTELGIARRLMRNPETCAEFLTNAAVNPEWFDLLNAGTMPTLMRLEDPRATNALFWFLSSIIEQRTGEVIALLRPHLGESDEWNNFIASCLDRLPMWHNDEALDLLCDLLRQYSANGGKDFHLSLHNLAKTNPVGGCRALRAYLDRRLEDLRAQEEAVSTAVTGGESTDVESDFSASLRRSRFDWGDALFGEHSVGEILQKAVRECPEQIVEHLLPWFLRVIGILTSDVIDDENGGTSRASYAWDALFSSHWYGEYIGESAMFVHRITEALQHIARTQPAAFRRIAEDLARHNSIAVHRVLINSYLAAPETYTADIFAYLIGDARRLAVGDTDVHEYDSRRLYGVMFDLADAEQRTRLEQLVLTLEPEWEVRDDRFAGFMQLGFLKSVNAESLSEAARRRLSELEIRFPDFRLEEPRGSFFTTAESPIDETTLAEMSDDELLNAMREYGDSHERDERRNFFSGGAAELAAAIADQAKKAPEKFYELTCRFDETVSFRYPQAIINALADERQITADRFFDLVRRFSARVAVEDRRAICNALSRRSADRVPDDLLDMMTDWALTDSHPTEELWDTSDGHGKKHYGGDPHLYGINTTRGIATQSVCLCALKPQPPQIERTFDLLERVARDPSTAVRACGVEGLDWTLNRGQDERALTAFETMLDGHPQLLRTSVAHRLLHRTYYRYFERVRPLIEKLLDDDDDNTRQIGASLACLAAFQYGEANDLEARAVTGDARMRRGAARVYARQIGDPRLEGVCCRRLETLMRDVDQDVLTETGRCFQHMQVEQFDALRSFVEAFLASPALLPGARHLVRYFKDLAADEHETTLNVTERLLDAGGVNLFDMNKNRVLSDEEFVVLPLTVYTHADNPVVKERAMRLFERLLTMGSYAARQALGDWDRR